VTHPQRVYGDPLKHSLQLLRVTFNGALVPEDYPARAQGSYGTALSPRGLPETIYRYLTGGLNKFP